MMNRAEQNWNDAIEIGNTPRTIRIATLYRLDYRGRVISTQHAEYHSAQWGALVEMGFVTHSVDTLSL